MTDLFFSVQIIDAAKRLGLTAEFVKDRETFLRKVKEKPVLVIFDLNCAAAGPADLIRYIKSDPDTKDIPTLGFVPHVQIQLKAEAQAAGCDTVVARSVFAQTLPDILRRYVPAQDIPAQN